MTGLNWLGIQNDIKNKKQTLTNIKMKKLNNNKTILPDRKPDRGIKMTVLIALLTLSSFWGVAQTTFTNSSTITMGTGLANNGSVYPSNISVSGMSGVVSNVTVTLTNVTHTNPDDIDVVVQSPTGVNVVLMSDCQGTGDITNRTYTLSDAAANNLSDGSSSAAGTYKPTNYGSSDDWPSPGPGTLTQGTPSLADFDGIAPNGTWKLFVRDDALFSGGSIGGWSITITTCLPPVISASSNSPVCVGGTLNLSGTGGGTYSWTGPNSFSSTSQNPSISSVTSAAAGTYTLTVVSGGCTSTTTTSVTVNSSPIGVAPTSSTASVCSGVDFNLSANIGVASSSSNTADFAIPDNNPTGISSPITVSNAFLASQVVSVTININHTYDADLDIFLKAPNGSQIQLSTDNGGSGNNFTNTVFITGATAITSGSAPFTGNFAPEQAFSTLTGSANGTWNLVVVDDAGDDTGTLLDWSLNIVKSTGVTYSWSSVPSGFSSSSASPVTSATVNTTYSVTATAAGCSNSIGSVAVNVLAAPTASTSSNSPVCEDADINLNGSGGVSYAWSGPNGFSSSDQNPVISAAALAAGGTYTLTVTDAFGCTDDETVAVTVNDRPALSIGSQNNVTCNGGADGSVQMNVVGGTPAFTYFDGSNFSFDGSFTGYSAGMVTITVTDNLGCEDTEDVTFTEPGPITVSDAGTDQLLCNAGTSSLSGNAAVVGVGAWSVISGTANITDPSSPTSSLTGLGTGTNVLRWTITQVGCSSNFDEVTIVNSPSIPAQPGTITGVTVACPPLVGESFSIAPVADALSYLWYVAPTSNGITFTTPVDGTSITADFAATTNSGYTIRVHAINGCGIGNYQSIFLRRTVSTPQIAGPTQACANDLKVYSVPSAVLGAVSYTWTGPAGTTFDGNASPFTTTSLSVNTQFAPGFVSGNICVTATGPCGIVTAQKCIAVSSLTGRPVSISGLLKACPGTSQAYSVSAVDGATSYNWSVPAGATISSGAGTANVVIDFSAGFTNGNICVTATNACGNTGLSRCINVQKATPTLPGNVTGPVGGLCGGTYTYSVPSEIGVLSYNWTVPSGAVILSGANTNSVQVDFSGVTFPSAANQYLQMSVSKTNSCSSGPARTISVKGVPSNAASVSGSNSVCAGDNGLVYSVPAVFGATNYAWTVPSDATIISGQGTNSIVVDWGNFSGTIGVTASNACGSGGTRTLLVNVGCRISGVNASSAVDVNLYPNPASQNTSVSFKAEGGTDYKITLLDLTGRVISTKTGTSVEGLNEIDIDLSQIAKGAYMINLVNNDQTSQIRLIVE